MPIYIFICSICMGIAVDIYSKFLAEMYIQSPIYILGDWLKLQISHNTWVAFSLDIFGLYLPIVTIGIILGICYYYIHTERPKKDIYLDTGYVLLLSGAISHAYERLYIGHVVDFIALRYFPVFNIADIFISIGVCIILITTYIYDRKHH